MSWLSEVEVCDAGIVIRRILKGLGSAEGAVSRWGMDMNREARDRGI